MITFAGVSLSYEDPEGRITRWIERFLPLDDLRDQTGPAALRSQRPASRSEYQPGVNLPLPNYPDPPRPKLSTLYWPSGAARWSRGYFLATGTQVNEILDTLGNGEEPGELVLEDEGNNKAITALMYLLSPRPITAPTVGDERLYLLVLVDQRYFWQFADSGPLTVTTSSTWADVFGQLEASLGAEFSIDSIAGEYFQPDPDELTRPYENAAILLDACARSVGKMVVANLDGTFSILSPESSADLFDINFDAAQQLTAGGTFITNGAASIFPESVVVTFQKYREGAVYPSGDVFAVTTNAEELAYAGAPGQTKIIHSTAFADFSGLEAQDAGNPTPINDAALTALAFNIAADYYGSLANRYDAVMPSLFPWIPCGFDDSIEWTLGRLCGGQYQAQTRAQSLPYNFGEEEQLQQFNLPVYPSPTRFILQQSLLPFLEPLPEGQGAPAVHMKFDVATGEWQETADQLTVWDPGFNAFPGFFGAMGSAAFRSERWEIIELDNRFLAATLLADLAPGGTSTALLNTPGATVVPVKAWFTTVSGSAGDKIYVRWDSLASFWWVVPKPGSTPLLGRPTDFIPNGQSGTVTIYSGVPGAETASTMPAVTAFNKFHGLVTEDNWVLVENNGSGWYITAAMQADHLYGTVVSASLSGGGGGTISATAPGGLVKVQLYDDSSSSRLNLTGAPFVFARVRFCPIFDLEDVLVHWTGNTFTVGKGSYDGGIFALAPTGIAENANKSDCQVAIGGNLYTLNFPVYARLGAIPTNKHIRISRNFDGLEATSAEC